MHRFIFALLLLISLNVCASRSAAQQEPDYLRQMAFEAVESKSCNWARWGDHPTRYSSWTNHSNRLVPIYTFGLTLERYTGDNSPYRNEEALRAIYGYLPDQSIDPRATYMDQTQVYGLQKDAIEAGKKYIFLIVFDGMDWQTTQAAAIYRTKKVGYEKGYGSGLAFLDYDKCPKDKGDFVCSPHNTGTNTDVDSQTVSNVGGDKKGGYSPAYGGYFSWSKPPSESYLLGKLKTVDHVYTDSAASATSMTTGAKTFVSSINVDPEGQLLTPIARELQARNFKIGIVVSGPISHATPACAYANNVTRNDYQDLTRDMLGLPSVANSQPLPGVDVLIGCGWGEERMDDRAKQGKNYIPGNKYLADEDRNMIDFNQGGQYVIADRTAGQSGAEQLSRAANLAVYEDARLLGFFGTKGGHLPYQTADGGYDPTRGVSAAERYTAEDIQENPTLAEMTKAALKVLGTNETGFWMMIEAADVDWANHNNNIDDSIGAVFSGEAAFRAVTDWVEENSNWEESAVIVTADHGHFLVLTDPTALTGGNIQTSDVMTGKSANKSDR